MVIELSEQQQKDAAECAEMAKLAGGKGKDCFGCSCNVCVLDCRVNSVASAAPGLLEACKDLVSLLNSKEPVEVGCHCTDSGEGLVKCAWCNAKAAIKKAEGKK